MQDSFPACSNWIWGLRYVMKLFTCEAINILFFNALVQLQIKIFQPHVASWNQSYELQCKVRWLVSVWNETLSWNGLRTRFNVFSGISTHSDTYQWALISIYLEQIKSLGKRPTWINTQELLKSWFYCVLWEIWSTR